MAPRCWIVLLGLLVAAVPPAEPLNRHRQASLWRLDELVAPAEEVVVEDAAGSSSSSSSSSSSNNNSSNSSSSSEGQD